MASMLTRLLVWRRGGVCCIPTPLHGHEVLSRDSLYGVLGLGPVIIVDIKIC